MAPVVARQSTAPQSKGLSPATIGIICAGALIIGSFIIFAIIRRLRINNPEPTYLPGKFLKTRWRRWKPVSRTAYRAPATEDEDASPTVYRRADPRGAVLSDMESTTHAGDDTEDDFGLGRNVSIRSVMTLPAYSKAAGEHEHVLGREGERDGIDVVIEAPETAEEEEERRDEEMESLYQIRRQRRQEIAEREDRRLRRQQAREQQDYATLRAIRLESAQSAEERETSGAMAMIAEHQSRSRERRVSSVSYGDLGIARHDGSRIRAGSAGSDQQPLLDSAASISGRAGQAALALDSLSIHRRGRSTSSLASTIDPDIEGTPRLGRSGSDFEIVTLNSLHSRNGSRSGTPMRSRASSMVRQPSIDTTIPLHQPPAYDSSGFEEAPPYVSPATEARLAQLPQIQTVTAGDAPSLPALGRLPSIRVAAATPIEPRQTEAFPPF